MKISDNDLQVPASASDGSRVTELLTISSAFLIQWVLLLIAKWILPWFNGAASVWVHILGFGLVTSSIGCLIGFFLTRRLSGATVKIPQWAILVGMLACLPVGPGTEWIFVAPVNSVALILKLFLFKAGPTVIALSYFIGARIAVAQKESLDAPVLICRAALLGSAVSVLAFLFFLNPLLSNSQMDVGFSWCVLAFAIVAGWWIWREPGSATSLKEKLTGPGVQVRILQIGLSGSAVALLLVITSRLQRDSVSDPVLWITPLAIFFFSLFANLVLPSIRNRKFYISLFVVGFGLLVVTWMVGLGLSFKLKFILNALALVGGCLACFGELTRRTDAAAFGGVVVRFCVGSIIAVVLVVFVPPRVATGYTEFPVALFGLAVFIWLSVALSREGDSDEKSSRSLVWIGGGIGLVLLGAALGQGVHARSQSAAGRIRTFYGVTSARQVVKPPNSYMVMMSGDYPRAAEFMSPDLRLAPAFWHGPVTGVGQMFTAMPKGNFRNIGIIGVGNGGLLGYLDATDKVTFYEHDAGVIVTAEQQFAYLPTAIIKWEFVPGNPRLALSDSEPQKFDILILDAFNSESLPTHLLTQEAFEIWKNHLAADGILAINITNRKFDLAPVVWRQALEAGWETIFVGNPDDPANLSTAAEWMLLTNNKEFITKGKFPTPSTEMSETARQFPLWTDEIRSPLSVIK